MENAGKREGRGDGGSRKAGGVHGALSNEKGRWREIKPMCSITMQCVSVWLGEDIIKETQGRLGSWSHGGLAMLPSLLLLNLYNLPQLQSL